MFLKDIEKTVLKIEENKVHGLGQKEKKHSKFNLVLQLYHSLLTQKKHFEFLFILSAEYADL